MSASGSRAVAMMSTSRTVSRRRRALPASDTLSAAGFARSSSTASSSVGSAIPSSALAGPPVSRFFSARALRTFSSLLGPSPDSVRSCSASAASRNPSSVVMPSSCQIRRAVFGPRPGMRMNSTTSAGTSCLCFVSACTSPSSTIWTIFSSIVLPTPWSSFALPSSAICATEVPVSRMRVAARR